MLRIDEGNRFREWRDLIGRFYDNQISQEEIDIWQQDNLNKVINEASEKSTFYFQHFEGAAANLNGRVQLEELPFLSRHDISANSMEMLIRPMKSGGVYLETTGTTQNPVPCPRSSLELFFNISTVSSAVSRLLSDFNCHLEKSALIMGPSDLHATGDVLGGAFMDLDFTIFKAWPFSMTVSMDRVIGLVTTYQIEVIVATAGQLQMLCSACKSKGVDVKEDLNVKYIFLMGEILTKEAQSNISRIWCAEVFDFMYASQESGIVGTLADNGRLYVQSLSHICECVEIGGSKRLGYGELGELVVTTILPGKMKPLIRYRTGDSCVLDRRENQYLQSPTIEMKGRISDYLVLGGRKYSPVDIDSSIMGNFKYCIGYKLKIDNEKGKDKVVIDIEFYSGVEQVGIDSLISLWNSYDVDCDVNVVDEMISKNAFTGSAPWKSARIVDSRVDI